MPPSEEGRNDTNVLSSIYTDEHMSRDVVCQYGAAAPQRSRLSSLAPACLLPAATASAAPASRPRLRARARPDPAGGRRVPPPPRALVTVHSAAVLANRPPGPATACRAVHQAQQGAHCPFCRATILKLDLVRPPPVPPAQVALAPARAGRPRACAGPLLLAPAFRAVRRSTLTPRAVRRRRRLS